jgi:hypothetical protein
MHGSRSKIPSKKSRPYIYDVKFPASLGAPYIYDISRLRVNVFQRIHNANEMEKTVKEKNTQVPGKQFIASYNRGIKKQKNNNKE